MHAGPASHARHTLDGALRILLADILFLPTGLLTAAFLTRRLGPEGYGQLSLATALITWIEWILLSAFSRATIKLVGESKDWRPIGATALRVNLIASGCGVFLLCGLAAAIASLLREPALARYLRLCALGIPLVAVAAVHRQILIGLGKFTEGALVSAARWISRLVLIVSFVELGLSVQGAILGGIGASAIEVAVARFYVRPSLLSRPSFPGGRLWQYAVPLFVFALSSRLFSNLDLFALKILSGTAAQAGIYGAAQSLAMIPAFLVLSLSPLLLSTLSRAVRERGGEAAREIGAHALRAVIALLPLICIIAGGAPEIVAFFFGPKFLPAAPLLIVLIFGVLARSTTTVTTTILTAGGRPGWTSALSAPLVPLAIAGHWLLIPRFGPLGASMVTAVLSVLGALAGFLAVYRLWRVHPPAATVLRSALLCVPAYTLARVWPAPGPWLFLKLPAIGLLVLLGFLLLGEFSSAEIALGRSLLGWRALREREPGEG